MDVLSDVSDDDLRKVLADLEQKRKRDGNYIRDASKRVKLQKPPVARDIFGLTVYFEPTLDMSMEDIDALCRERGLTKALLKDPCTPHKLTSFLSFNGF